DARRADRAGPRHLQQPDQRQRQGWRHGAGRRVACTAAGRRPEADVGDIRGAAALPRRRPGGGGAGADGGRVRGARRGVLLPGGGRIRTGGGHEERHRVGAEDVQPGTRALRRLLRLDGPRLPGGRRRGAGGALERARRAAGARPQRPLLPAAGDPLPSGGQAGLGRRVAPPCGGAWCRRALGVRRPDRGLGRQRGHPAGRDVAGQDAGARAVAAAHRVDGEAELVLRQLASARPAAPLRLPSRKRCMLC
ncbi:unnamed protein product, partial [Prorocentrum cordatum]